jgi:hypothetical protein
MGLSSSSIDRPFENRLPYLCKSGSRAGFFRARLIIVYAHIFMPYALGLALALSSALGTAPATSTTAAVSFVSAPQAQTIRDQVESYFYDIPIMVDIAQCESHFRQFAKDGEVYRGKVNNRDVGVMQVNEDYHLETSKKLGIDIYTLEGNMQYARYLYEKEGATPWNSSKPCWGKTKNAKFLASAGK